MCCSPVLQSPENPPQQLPRHSLRAGAIISWPVSSLLESRAVGFCVHLKSILQLRLCRSLQAFCKLQRELCSLHIGQGTLTEASHQFTGGGSLFSVSVRSGEKITPLITAWFHLIQKLVSLTRENMNCLGMKLHQKETRKSAL